MSRVATEEQWKVMFEQAIQLKKMKPWSWMGIGQVFAIQDPETKINYYCSISGGEGIHDGVQIMVGEKGFAQFLHMVEVEFARLDESEYPSEVALNRAMFDQHSFFCHFINRDDLDQRDYQLIKGLGYSFKGNKQWIQFRYVCPGYLPSPIADGDKVELVTMLLEQIIQVAKEAKSGCKIDDILADDEQNDEMLYRVSELDGDGQRIWYDYYGDLEEMGEPIGQYIYQDEFMTRKIKGLKSDKNHYEFIRFYTPIPIVNERGELPCPSMLVLANINRKTVNFEYGVIKLDGEEDAVINALIGYMLSAGVKPGMVYLSDEELLAVLEDFFDKVGIAYDLVEYTPEADEIMDEAYRCFFDEFNAYLSSELKKMDNNLEGILSEDEEKKERGSDSKVVDLFSGRPIES